MKLTHPTTLTASRGYGGGKPWIAQVTGTSVRFGMHRVFLAARATSSKSGATGRLEATIVETGLYETCDTKAKGKESTFHLVVVIDGETISRSLRDSSGLEIAAALEDGKSVDDLRCRLNDDGKIVYRTADGALDFGAPDVTPEPAPVETPAPADRAQRIDLVRALMADLGVTLADLS